jgi:hypothetical protein
MTMMSPNVSHPLELKNMIRKSDRRGNASSMAPSKHKEHSKVLKIYYQEKPKSLVAWALLR